MINIHPSLLPLFRGPQTHRRALGDGVLVHGCTVHFVVPELDAGPIIAQAAVPVVPGDTEASLAARVLVQEHILYPKALRTICDGTARLDNGRVVFSRVGVAGDDRRPLAVDRRHELWRRGLRVDRPRVGQRRPAAARALGERREVVEDRPCRSAGRPGAPPIAAGPPGRAGGRARGA